MKPETITFLRKEARRFYRELGPAAQKLIPEDKIYKRLKQVWKSGQRLSLDERTLAEGMPMNFKEIKEQFVGEATKDLW